MCVLVCVTCPQEDEAALEVEDIEDTLDSDAGSDPGDGVPASTSSTLHTLGHRVGRSTITTSGGGGGGGIIGSGGIAAPRATITRTNPLFAHGGVEGDSGAWSAPGVSGSSAVSPVRSLPPIAGRRVPVTVLPGSVGLPPKRTKPSRWWLDDDQDPELGIEEVRSVCCAIQAALATNAPPMCVVVVQLISFRACV